MNRGYLMKSNNIYNKFALLVCSLVLTGALNGCATTATNPDDPWEGWNRGTMEFNDTIDEYAMKPIAEGYRWINHENLAELLMALGADTVGPIGLVGSRTASHAATPTT